MADFELIVVELWVFFVDVSIGDEIGQLEELVEIEIKVAEVVAQKVSATLFDEFSGFLKFHEKMGCDAFSRLVGVAAGGG